MRGAIIALSVLVLSFALFATTFAFTILRQQAPAMPVVIQTTLPATDATATDPAAQGTAVPATAGHTATPVSRGGGQVSQPTPTPAAPPASTPLPTVVPPTPTDVPQPTPTRLPQ